MQNSPGPNSTAKMHKYILGLTGVMVAFGVSFPIAMIRVSATPKFASQPFNSQTCDAKQPPTRTVTSWVETCSRLSVAPIVPKPSPAASPAAIAPKPDPVVPPAAIVPKSAASPEVSPAASPAGSVSDRPAPETNPAAPTPVN